MAREMNAKWKSSFLSIYLSIYLFFWQVDTMNTMVAAPQRPVTQAPPKVTPSIIQAAPTVYTAPPAPKRPDMRAQRQARIVKTFHTYTVHVSSNFRGCINNISWNISLNMD